MAGPPELSVRVRGLVKRYGDLVAVDGIDFDATEGTCLGILGPNGAGKTTTVEILEGLKAKDEGFVEVLHRSWETDAREIRERIGVQLQETELPEKLTAAETVAMFRSLYRQRRPVDEVLEIVGLTEKRGARVVELSGGQRQRLALGCAIVNRPELLFLDEPTTGLDPQARRRVWEVVEDIKAGGGTVLLTTHYMDEAERLADDLVIIDRGSIIARGSPAEIIDGLQTDSVVELVPRAGSRLDVARLEALAPVGAVRREADTIVLAVNETQRAVSAILARLDEDGVELTALRTHRPTLEDVFVSLTGKHLRDSG